MEVETGRGKVGGEGRGKGRVFSLIRKKEREKIQAVSQPAHAYEHTLDKLFFLFLFSYLFFLITWTAKHVDRAFDLRKIMVKLLRSIKHFDTDTHALAHPLPLTPVLGKVIA